MEDEPARCWGGLLSRLPSFGGAFRIRRLPPLYETGVVAEIGLRRWFGEPERVTSPGVQIPPTPPYDK